jgi:hypothetical protein
MRNDDQPPVRNTTIMTESFSDAERPVVRRRGRPSKVGVDSGSRRGDTLVSFDLPSDLKIKARELAQASGLTLAEYIRGIMAIAARENVKLRVEFQKVS